ncbi:MAG: glucose-6-phosphate isomerase family protein [Candidatus Micrarchaeota archaeon]
MKLNVQSLDLEYNGGKLYVSDQEHKPDIRTLEQMKDLLFDIDYASKQDKHTPLYHMYRDIVPELKKDGYRYDITILSPTPLGNEFNKTFGHYHPTAVENLSYTELYNVLHGEAHYLLQKPANDWRLEEVVLLKAKKGDCIPMPPNYGHITINPGKEPLIMANLVSPDFSSEYREYQTKKGGAYYELVNGKTIPNPLYEALPELKMKKGGCKAAFKPDILAAFYKDPKPFEFLKDPRLYKD